MATKTELTALKLAYSQNVPYRPMDEIMVVYSDVRTKLICVEEVF
jgi:hypothetical protein